MNPEWPIHARRATHEAESDPIPRPVLTRAQKEFIEMYLRSKNVERAQAQYERLRASHDQLLAAVKAADDVFKRLYSSNPVRIQLHDAIAGAAAIAAAEEQAS